MLLRLTKVLLAAMFCAEWLAVLTRIPPISAAASILLAAAVLCGLGLLARSTQVFVAIMMVIGIAALSAGGDIGAAIASLPQATAMITFLLSLHFLKAALDLQPGLSALRQRFLQVPAGERDGAIALATNILAVVLTVGVVPLLAPLVDNADEATRLKTAEIGVNGVASSVLWSPFTAATALISTLLPSVQLSLVYLLGFFITAGGVVWNAASGDYDLHPRRLGGVLRMLVSILAPAALLTVAMIALARVTGIGIIDAGVLLIAPCVTIFSLLTRDKAASHLSSSVWDSMTRFLDDMALFSFAIVLAGLCLSVPAVAAMMAASLSVAKPSVLLILALASSVALLPLAGMHMVLPTTMIFTALSANAALSPPALTAIVLLVLVAWSVGSMAGKASIGLLTASRWFAVDRKLILASPGLRKAFAYRCSVAALLAVLYQVLPA